MGYWHRLPEYGGIFSSSEFLFCPNEEAAMVLIVPRLYPGSLPYRRVYFLLAFATEKHSAEAGPTNILSLSPAVLQYKVCIQQAITTPHFVRLLKC